MKIEEKLRHLVRELGFLGKTSSLIGLGLGLLPLAIWVLAPLLLQETAGYLPSAYMQYPVVRPSATVVSETVSLAGARNESLFIHFQLNEADPATFTARADARGAAATLSPVEFHFLQLCWAPSGSKGTYQPDALLPLGHGLVSTGAPPEVLAILKIPKDLPRGFYDYEVELADNARTYRQPLKLRVYDFSLPDDLPITIFGVFRHYGQSWFSRYNVSTLDAYLQVSRDYYRNLRSYKINSLGGSYYFPFEELTPATQIEDFTSYHQLFSYALNYLGFRFCAIPHLNGWETVGDPGSKFVARGQIFFPLFQDYLGRNGWAGRGLNYLVDEPKAAQSSNVLAAYSLAKDLAPAIQTMSAGWTPDPQWVEVIDIWAMQASKFSEIEMAQAQQQGQERWLYDNPLHGIDHPLVHQRLIGWLLHRYQFSGYLLWGVNYWPGDPWTTATGDADYFRRGTFYYPHPSTGQPVPTYRLESLRRGFQDFQYLTLLTEAYQQGRVNRLRFSEITQRVHSLTQDLATNSFAIPMQDLEDLRLQMGELLDNPSQVSPVRPFRKKPKAPASSLKGQYRTTSPEKVTR